MTMDFVKVAQDDRISDWDLLQKLTENFKCVFIVGAGNHFARTKTIGQIAANIPTFKVLRNYKVLSDKEFEKLVRNKSPFGRQKYYYKKDSDECVVVRNDSFDQQCFVKKSFCPHLKQPIRINHQDQTADVAKLSFGGDSDRYKKLLLPIANVTAEFEPDIDIKYHEYELVELFPQYLKDGAENPNPILNPFLEHFYESFNKPNCFWLNLNQDGVLEEFIDTTHVVSYHGNVKKSVSDLIPPGYSGAIDDESYAKASEFVQMSDVVISLGFSFSTYDEDIIEILDRNKKDKFVVFDLNEEAVKSELRAHFPKADIIARNTKLPISIIDR